MSKIKVWDEYLRKLDVSQSAKVTSVLKQAVKFAPEAEPAMPYGVPGFKLKNKPLIAVAAHKNHYGVYPFSAGVITELGPLIEKYDTAKGTIRFTYDQKPTDKLIKEIIKLRSAEIS